MAILREGGWTVTSSIRNHPATAVAAALLVSLSALFAGARAALPEADQQCLGCHSAEGLEKQLESGEKLSLTVAGEAFAKSVHGVVGCGACHADIDLEKHPGTARKFANSRAFSTHLSAACRQCHEEVSRRHETSVHASLLRSGNPAAPVCADCHGSHSVSPRTAYDTCTGCHDGAATAHQKWLPNAALHLEVVSCAACHAPAAPRMVDLRLYDDAAQKWVSEKEGQQRFEKLARSIDRDGNGLDAIEVRDLLAEINRDGAGTPRTLRGRIELREGVEAHRLSGKIDAIRDCDSCHRDGAEPFRTVAISVVGPDGRPVRYSAHREVLSSALSVDSLRLFYAIGGTRNPVLDVLLVLALLAGASVPVGHQAMKWFVRKRAGRGAGKSPSE